MEINNFQQISQILTPLEKGDFYFCQIISRKKDGNDIKGDSKTIKSYYVDYGESLFDIEQSVIKNCKEHNARAYIRLQKRNWFKIALQIISTLASEIANGTVRNLKDIVNSTCGKYSSDKQKFWIIDVDSKKSGDMVEILSDVQKIENINPIFIEQLETVNGYHIITKPFNPQLYKGNCEIKKEGMTLLYFNKQDESNTNSDN